jgi:hypothetical protein
MREPAGLIARIRQIRRTADASATAPRKVASKDDPIGLRVLQARVEHLEQLVEGFRTPSIGNRSDTASGSASSRLG